MGRLPISPSVDGMAGTSVAGWGLGFSLVSPFFVPLLFLSFSACVEHLVQCVRARGVVCKTVEDEHRLRSKRRKIIYEMPFTKV